MVSSNPTGFPWIHDELVTMLELADQAISDQAPVCFCLGCTWWKKCDKVVAQRARNLIMAFFNFGRQPMAQPMYCQADFFRQYEV